MNTKNEVIGQLSLREAREQGRLAEFIEQHSEELAEDEEFIRLLQRVERNQKVRRSGYVKP